MFPMVCIFDFGKNMNPYLYILFLVDKSDVNYEHMF